jgi:site-specific recombinase XerD
MNSEKSVSQLRNRNPGLFVADGRNANGAKLSKSGAQCRQTGSEGTGISPLPLGSCRHSRTTQLPREGMSLEVMQEFLDHVDVSTTRGIYGRFWACRLCERG